MKRAEIASRSEDALNLMMADLTPLFRRTVDTNYLAQSCLEFLI